ncbi:dihydrouridine synthase-domain-containing protein [Gorgonomyces haynaldii]|nr:dihydrouridine synthase-domain-containing protein [Gorgonomyces haynaldii]
MTEKSWDFFKRLGSPKNIVAPMVDQSEYAWRILSFRYNADLCYTPMFHARNFASSEKYRNGVFTTGPEDKNIIVQFCANEPDWFFKAAQLVQDKCKAVDLNLGCPQGIARKGQYGAFLMDDVHWDTIAKMVNKIHTELDIPVTCKIRIFPDVEKTLRYAKMIQDAGCQLLTVHGRLREQKGQLTGLADWEQIKRVREALDIPVVANGNILYKEDVDRCIQETGVVGVMTAEGSLYNPCIFSGKYYAVVDICQEYLNICKSVPGSAQLSEAKNHIFKLAIRLLNRHTEIREMLGKAKKLEDLQQALDDYTHEYTGPIEVDENGIKQLPDWVCQPWIRPPAEELMAPNPVKQAEKRKLKEQQPKQEKKQLLVCKGCQSSVASARCGHQLCKKCCIRRFQETQSECPGHIKGHTKAKHESQQQSL